MMPLSIQTKLKVNIMTFALPNEASINRGGAAVWDIFPADATDTIRTFLRESVDPNIDDPVLRQAFYISTPLLEKLREEYHVVPWRIYQNPGDAVFIPAGCAHQVQIIGTGNRVDFRCVI
jgi:[histone H3]-dimethyl-L-lysine9 demethylase